VNDEFVKWIGFIGSLASLIGLPIAIWQIVKTRHAAEAAKEASLKTQKDISRNLLISDIATCVKHVEEIRLYLRDESYEIAQIRINDLNSQLIQTEEGLKVLNPKHQTDFQAVILEITKIRDDFRKKLNRNSAKINKVRINNQLDIVSDSLNKIIGEIRIFVEKGE
jgi:hypothetical protein